ncbi:hypothetical protein STPYR_10335 [uncultured Stenotrophomonas sp.]|uniref:Uncharacterized protein n=1 Tax=uncultured Stenotrophomonas sp. TaxID=165438 RepID=A0A1Y5Q3N9_9GAMM|nr:hypothetical protein STPYR_10335 [uncultured Stenotrophomonas sp.]
MAAEGSRTRAAGSLKLPKVK